MQGDPDIRKNSLKHLKGAVKLEGLTGPVLCAKRWSKVDSRRFQVGFSDILQAMPSNVIGNNQ